MGTRIIYICDRCGSEIEYDAPGYREWRVITQAWVDGDRVSTEGVTLCSRCLEDIGLYTLFYPEGE